MKLAGRPRSTWRLAPILALAGSAAWAGVVRIVPLPEFVSRAAVIAVAQAESSESRWENGRIVTYTTVVVRQPVRGAADGTRLAIGTLGGEVGGIGQRVFGEPRLRVGERYLVFLERPDGRDWWRPVGMAQGILPVVEGPAGDVVEPNADLCAAAGHAAGTSVSPWLSSPRPLAEALADVRAEVARASR